MRHVRTISRKPQFAQQSTSDLTFLLSILELVGTLFGTFVTSFLGVFDGVLDHWPKQVKTTEEIAP